VLHYFAHSTQVAVSSSYVPSSHPQVGGPFLWYAQVRQFSAESTQVSHYTSQKIGSSTIITGVSVSLSPASPSS